MVMKAIIQTVLKILSSKENNFGWPINLLPLSFFPRINTTNHQYFFKNNKTGVTGVGFSGKSFYAQWVTLDGKQKVKSFSVALYGKELAFELAVEERTKAIESLNLQGAGYAESHGREKIIVIEE